MSTFRIDQIARSLGAHRTGNHWRGMCPACHYGAPTLLLKERRGRISFACVSCGDRDAIAAALVAAGGGERIDRADPRWTRSARPLRAASRRLSGPLFSGAGANR